MLHPANDMTSNFGPVDTSVQLFVDQPTDSHIFSSYKVQPVSDLFAVVGIITGPNDAFDGVLEDKVRELIARQEVAGQRSAVCCEDEDFFWKGKQFFFGVRAPVLKKAWRDGVHSLPGNIFTATKAQAQIADSLRIETTWLFKRFPYPKGRTHLKNYTEWHRDARSTSLFPFTMSAAATPIPPHRFAEAIADLPLANLHDKAAEIRNSISHLEHSNEQLQQFADQGDTDCTDAIAENRVVIQRMEERISLLKEEVERRGYRWGEDEDGEGKAEAGGNGHAEHVGSGDAEGRFAEVTEDRLPATHGSRGPLQDDAPTRPLAEGIEEDGEEEHGLYL
ncbi:MAG: hypothetical protein Q9163_005232 [Psora crenata]